MAPTTRPGVFFSVFGGAFLLSFIGMGIYVYNQNPTNTIAEHAVAILEAMEPVIVFFAALGYIVAEGGEMLAEMFKRRRFQEGREEGREEGRQERDSVWHEWYKRMESARAKGETFNEPPPTRK